MRRARHYECKSAFCLFTYAGLWSCRHCASSNSSKEESEGGGGGETLVATGWEADGGSGRLDSMFAVVVVALVAMARVCLFTSRHQSRL